MGKATAEVKKIGRKTSSAVAHAPVEVPKSLRCHGQLSDFNLQTERYRIDGQIRISGASEDLKEASLEEQNPNAAQEEHDSLFDGPLSLGDAGTISDEVWDTLDITHSERPFSSLPMMPATTAVCSLCMLKAGLPLQDAPEEADDGVTVIYIYDSGNSVEDCGTTGSPAPNERTRDGPSVAAPFGGRPRAPESQKKTHRQQRYGQHLQLGLVARVRGAFERKLFGETARLLHAGSVGLRNHRAAWRSPRRSVLCDGQHLHPAFSRSLGNGGSMGETSLAKGETVDDTALQVGRPAWGSGVRIVRAKGYDRQLRLGLFHWAWGRGAY
ncbi:hypothetical protein POSPLADRAFT_1130422 [Postia placenta MAD-698-R-SB12]|uniref:Uncharacterized protein n=1 Tax=Postia placenta MAD-698-R-SB12 TaxID=670580 RepID=A0A1X6NGZ3_9APHY|nr:hypothetical protein POSPLADRAFT_1130422 [Postia placenta MAD-698-R-SB12]OSX67907.1 hypothetical protein POSPLADRAFT_1130422 [Postia placenta MAD-698-R-SB12]